MSEPLEPLAALKQRILAQEAILADRFWQGDDTVALVAERAAFIDGFLCELWHHWFPYDEEAALLAVGGYGRGELHPKSDIDLLILIRRPTLDDERIGEFVRLLWDLQLEIGHSVRTIRECKAEARRDISVMTALTERRLLIGSSQLAQKLDRALNSKRLWPSRQFFQAKLEEQEVRHEHYSDVEYGLEPNVKSSPGGLRDVQTIYWVTQYHCKTTDLRELMGLGYLTDRECSTLLEGRNFLWKVRFALHLLANRKLDQLYFDHQRTIAERFGYKDTDGLLGVEAFMRDYYRYVMELREVNDILIQHFSEEILPKRRRSLIEPIDESFRVHNEYIETVTDDVFEKRPAALLEIFVTMANQEGIKGVRANTIRLIRRHLHLIDDDFRADPEVAALFIALLKSPYTVVSQLTRMRRYGILGRYIPEFGQIIGQMQHDLFHIYTVDAHTMTLLRNLRRMFMPEYQEQFPITKRAIANIEKVELLFLAGLFHDIGKGRGGNHSALGATYARQFCQQLGLSKADQDLVAWLVQRHLLMSTTSQREDLWDPESIHKFAVIVQSPERLHHLLALTVADIHATNPKEWSAIREALLLQLYSATLTMLARGDYGPNERIEEIERRHQATAKLLEERLIRNVDLDALWEDVTQSFVLAHDPARLADVAISINRARDENADVVELFPSDNLQLLEVFIYTQDRPRLFADCVIALNNTRLNVVQAYIATGKSKNCYDSFIVTTEDGTDFIDERLLEIERSLRDVLEHGFSRAVPPSKRLSRQLKQFNTKARVTCEKPDSAGLSRLEIVTADRPGLLALLVSVLAELDLNIHQARISTLGERAEDLFVVSGTNSKSLLDPYATDDLETELAGRLNSELPRLVA